MKDKKCIPLLSFLSPAERNYDVGNRERLAVKLTLEEWRHWLEGAKYSFTVLSLLITRTWNISKQLRDLTPDKPSRLYFLLDSTLLLHIIWDLETRRQTHCPECTQTKVRLTNWIPSNPCTFIRKSLTPYHIMYLKSVPLITPMYCP